jgi:hypothetical protein
MLNKVYRFCYIPPRRTFLQEYFPMCSTFDRFLGYCGYMPPTTKLALVSVVVAAFIAMALTARS